MSSSFFNGTTTDSIGATMPRFTSCAPRSATDDGGDVSTAFVRWAVTPLSLAGDARHLWLPKPLFVGSLLTLAMTLGAR